MREIIILLCVVYFLMVFWAFLATIDMMIDDTVKVDKLTFLLIFIAPFYISFKLIKEVKMRNFILLCCLIVMSASTFGQMSIQEIKLSFEEKKIHDAYLEGMSERIKNLMPMDRILIDNLTQIKNSHEQKVLDITKLPDSIDFRKYATSVRSQFNGTCTAYGLTAVKETQICYELGICNLDLSERHYWSFYEQYSATEAMKHAGKFQCEESLWPQASVKNVSCTETLSNYRIKNLWAGQNDKQLLLTALSTGHMVYFWSHVPKDMIECRATISRREFIDGGHAYAVVGYVGKEDPILIIKNSWGDKCGDKGYQYMKLSTLNPRQTGTGYWSFAWVDGVEKKSGICKEVCRPRFFIFGKVCETKCE